MSYFRQPVGIISPADLVRISIPRPVAINTHLNIKQWCKENQIKARWVKCQVILDNMLFIYSIPDDKQKTAFILRWS